MIWIPTHRSPTHPGEMLLDEVLQPMNLSQPDKPLVALRCSTDTGLEPVRLYEYDKARFHIEFIFRAAKQFTGLNDGQSRQQDALDVPIPTTPTSCATGL